VTEIDGTKALMRNTLIILITAITPMRKMMSG